MNQLLKRIGLLDNLTFELPISRSDFVNILQSNIDAPQSDFADMFSRSKNLYKGTVSYDGFELKRKKRFFEMNINRARSKGMVTQKADKLIVDIEVNGFHYAMIPILVIAVIAYSMAIAVIVIGKIQGDDVAVWSLPFIFIHAALMFGIPYFILRRSLRSARYDIERDIFFIMKDKLNSQHREL